MGQFSVEKPVPPGSTLSGNQQLVISQPEAVSNMAVPTFDRTLAVQMTVKATELKAPQREGVGGTAVTEELGFARKSVP